MVGGWGVNIALVGGWWGGGAGGVSTSSAIDGGGGTPCLCVNFNESDHFSS